MGIRDHLTCLLRNLYAGQEGTLRTGHGTTDWFYTLMGQGKLKLSYLPETTLLLSGDEVLTSGMGGVYPSGLKVATIDEILTEPSGMGRYAILSPAADLNGLHQAFVITQFDIVE